LEVSDALVHIQQTRLLLVETRLLLVETRLLLVDDGAELVDDGAEFDGVRFGPCQHCEGKEHNPKKSGWH
jgi:hypothetical protein